MTQNRQGTVADAEDPGRAPLQRRLLLLPFCIAVFSLSALFYYHLRRDVIAVESPLQVVYSGIYSTFGFAPSLMFFLLLLIWTSIWFFSGRIERPWSRLLRLAATTVMLGVFLNVGGSGDPTPSQGELGAFFATRMVAAFGYYPTLVLVLIATLGALLLATDFLFSETFERLWARSTARAEDDVGVEDEVTDHLKGLGAAIQPAAQPASALTVQPLPPRVEMAPSASSADAAEDAAAAPQPETEEAVTAEAHDFGEFVDFEAAVEPDIEEPAPEPRSRRQSSFERRYDAARQAAAEAGSVAEPEVEEAAAEWPEDDWVPSAPDAQEIDNPESAQEPMFAIPRPDPSAVGEPAEEAPAEVSRADEAADAGVDEADVDEEDEEVVGRQQQLFAPGVDEELIDEARQVVLETRRASASFLRRRLRIGYDEARELLVELSARGVVELGDDSSQGRVLER